jgi:Gnt-I system high-affinity gluconate transporter
MSLLVVAVAIVVLILLVAWAKVHPFLAFVIVAGAAALVLGVPPASLPDMVKRGLGGVLGKLLITIVSGAMLGRLVVESGAAQKIATVLVDACGRSRISWAMAITGFIIGIPLFYGVGFVLVVPIVFAVTARYGLPPLVVGVPALAALSVAHGLLPPHPGPTGLVPVLRADMGLTLLYGVVIGVPAIVLAGPVFARTLARVAVRPLAGLETKQLADHELPGGLASILTALLPAVLLLVTTAVRLVLPSVIAAGGPWAAWAAAAEPWVALAADADVVMLLTLAVAAVTLGLLRGRSFASVMQTYASAIGDVASILLVIAGSGAFGAMLLESKVDATVTGLLRDLPVSPLLLAWVVTVIIRACVGSATVAGLTAAGLLAPLAATGDVDPNLMVLAIGSGSLALSHVNDAGFWLFKEYFSLSIADTLRSWTVMETIVAIVGLAGVLVLDRFV